MPMRGGTLWVTFVAVFAVAACSNLGVPEQGFVTRYVTGPSSADLQDTLPPSAVAPVNVPQSATGNVASQSEDCMAVARQRSREAAFQGFNEDVQKEVFDTAFADCDAWAAKHLRASR